MNGLLAPARNATKFGEQSSVVSALAIRSLGGVKPRRRRQAPQSTENLVRESTGLDAASLIGERLRAGARELIDCADLSTRARFQSLVSRWLCVSLSDAAGSMNARIGREAAGLDPERRIVLQDTALGLNCRPDDLLPLAVNALLPGQIVAVLAVACDAYSPGSLDAMRCRDTVYGERNTPAREAMLDMVQSDGGGSLCEILASVVAKHMVAQLAASRRFDEETLLGLAAALTGPHQKPSGRRSRRPDVVIEAIRDGHSGRATSLLAEAAGVPRIAVCKTVALRNVKGLASLANRAGFDAQTSTLLQNALARAAPDDVLTPASDGSHAMTEREMAWHCRFVAESGVERRADD